jgi:outer membrane receptor protein involved in Fe transport
MKKILMLTICLVGLYTYAQDTYKGKIIGYNNEPLAGATVQSKTNNNNAVVTDFDGNFSITLKNNKAVVVKFIGFKTVEQILSRSNNNIQLFENDQVLEEVVISASREKQLRKEVPASISVISSKDISKAKAFGIDQLINDVPGVNMTMSRAAGNEQHMMSVRSPISTKSLFLYLEDGLPIRPTAVFNHNALLEMNDVSFDKIEVLKGPASSIYGSEAIGGSFNFITKNPTRDFSGGLGFQINDLGLTKYELELSKYVSEKVGFYIGTHYVQRKDGPVSHSDYEKFAITFKNVNHLSPTLNWVNVFDLIDYRSDTSGSLSEEDYSAGNYESDQTFTNREAFSLRFRSTLDKQWNTNNKTSVNLIFRNNVLDQIPSYRISQRNATGETNSNKFKSYVGLIQHKVDFNLAKSSLIFGTTVDYSPQDYEAETISVTIDPETSINTDYSVNTGDYILNYDASILNLAAYLQYEINPIEALKLTAAIRFDKFEYDYDNLAEGVAGPSDSKNTYDNISPKIGVNYNISKSLGLYGNYSNGFTPPQTSSLYRNSFLDEGDAVFDLKPSSYDNYEIGTYFNLSNKFKADVAVYILDGKNTLISLRDENDDFFNVNAGKTKSYGIEYGLKYTPIEGLSISHNGTFSKHRYIEFFDSAVDYSDTDRESAPSLIGTSKITFIPQGLKKLTVSLTHEMVGDYNTSYENQVDNEDGTFSTATYDGHNVFNALIAYKFNKFEVWGHALNIFDTLYSPRASYSQWTNANTYTIGNPSAFHFGVKYHF